MALPTIGQVALCGSGQALQVSGPQQREGDSWVHPLSRKGREGPSFLFTFFFFLFSTKGLNENQL